MPKTDKKTEKITNFFVLNFKRLQIDFGGSSGNYDNQRKTGPGVRLFTTFMGKLFPLSGRKVHTSWRTTRTQGLTVGRALQAIP